MKSGKFKTCFCETLEADKKESNEVVERECVSATDDDDDADDDAEADADPYAAKAAGVAAPR